jgi:putative DNA primase/helicase
MIQRQHSAEEIRAALAHVPPDLPREEWVRVAMAIKSELGEAGRELFDSWSAGGKTYDSRAVRSTWKSVKSGGGVTIGTLFEMAKAGGYQPGTPSTSAPANREAVDQAAAARRARDEAEVAARAEAQAAAATRAREIWEQASREGASAYLERKHVQALGLRFTEGGGLLVPMRDGAGRVHNLQRIAPGGRKLFEKGGRTSGLWHAIGEPTSARAGIVCEGYATGATLHEASGLFVAVAFSAHNLPKVAQVLRALYPALPLIAAGDNDRETEATSGRNPGVESARKAARAVRGALILPEGLKDGTDFNDLARERGLEAVREIVEAGAVRALQALQQTAPSGEAGASEAGEDRFSVTARGVWYLQPDKDGGTRPLWICSPLTVEALTENDAGDGKGYWLAFTDQRGREKRWAMPARMFGGEGAEFRASLLDMGLRIGTGAAARNMLAAYIQSRQVQTFARCVERVGWHSGGVYVWPDRTFGPEEERTIFQAEERIRNPFRSHGTLDGWRADVAALCVGNARLAFAVSAAFAGPCLALAGLEGGGFHLRGASSAGKTTALRMAGSVYGGPDYLQTWRNTSNALEKMAEHFCDALLVLDELAQLDPKEIGDCAYLLANGQAKGRMNRGAALRPRSAWRVLFLSSGETGLADLLAETKKTARAGHEVRFVDLPSDAGKGLGIFETLHGEAGGAAFAERAGRAVRRHYGAAGAAFVEQLAGDREGVGRALREAVELLRRAWVTHGDASGQVRRVAARFAVVGAAGELATRWGLTGWPEGEAARAARALFDAWCEQRGGTGDGEEIAIVRQVAAVLSERGEANFPWWHRAADDHRPNSPNRWGLRRLLNGNGESIDSHQDHYAQFGDKISEGAAESATAEYYILTEPFRREVCKGFDPRLVGRVLVARGHLVTGEKGRADRKERLPGIGLARCYRIKPGIFEDGLL